MTHGSMLKRMRARARSLSRETFSEMLLEQLEAAALLARAALCVFA
jgi:hypothetical protein